MRSKAVLIRFVIAIILSACVAASFPRQAAADFQGTDGLLRLSSANTLAEGNWSVGLFGNYYQRMSPFAHSVKESYALGNLSGRYGLRDWFEVLTVLPGKGSLWKYNQLPDREEYDEDHGGPSDMQLALKMRVPLESQAYSVAILAQAFLPTGRDYELTLPGMQSSLDLFTSGSTNFLTRVCATFDFGQVPAISPLKLHVNAGYWLNREETVVRFPSYMIPVSASLDNKDVLIAGLGLEFPSSFVTLFTELYTEQLVNGSSAVKFKENPILLTPGAKVRLPYGFVATVAADVRLSGDDAATDFDPDAELPEWGLTVGLDFVPTLFKNDMDQDGVKDQNDLCPAEKEDLDSFQDQDGCPDPDNDNDGILDLQDRCPNEPETFNGYADEDGCPEPDSDGDTVADVADACPEEQEDLDGFQDDDGCPDPDNDADGIPDGLDRCPNEAETFNGYNDEDGCPDQAPEIREEDMDTDGDGIPNSKDRCPSLAEDKDGFQDDDGCPDIDNDLDGVIDSEDKCPNEPEDLDGDRDEDGCPDR